VSLNVKKKEKTKRFIVMKRKNCTVLKFNEPFEEAKFKRRLKHTNLLPRQN